MTNPWTSGHRPIVARALHAAPELAERGQEKVAERMTVQAVSARKPVLHDVAHDLGRVRQCDEAAANVARRQDAEARAQPA